MHPDFLCSLHPLCGASGFFLVLHFPLHHAAGFCFVLGCFLGLGPDFGLVSTALVGPAASVAVFGLADALVCLVVFQFMPPTVLFGFFPVFSLGWHCSWRVFLFLLSASACPC